MKNYRCQCGNTIYFENTRCLVCNRELGFLPDDMRMAAIEPQAGGSWQTLTPASQALYRKCSNYEYEAVCNWMVPADDPAIFCRACRLNHVIPDLSKDWNRGLWQKIERAKRRLIYTLLVLRLPVVGRDQDPARGLAFQFLADQSGEVEFTDDSGSQQVLTGHRDGLITINIAEADPVARESMRMRMGEEYRTLLGHFRHEIAHYYWDRLVRGSAWEAECRRLFGDERDDYGQALSGYYAEGPRPDWEASCVSAYASAHPWEDFAETWAHYMHMIDTLETSHDYAFAIGGRRIHPPISALGAVVQQAHALSKPAVTFADLMSDWSQLTSAMNALSRSMGLSDAYPFVLSTPAIEKLAFVHRLISAAAGEAS